MEMLTQVWDRIAVGYLPRLLGAVLILVGFWLVAVILSALVRKALRKTHIDEKLFRWLGWGEKDKVDSGRWIAKTIYYIVLIFGLIAFFGTLRLGQVSQPLTSLLDRVFAFLPQLASAAVLIGLAWIVATLVWLGVSKLLQATGLDEKLGDTVEVAEGRKATISGSIANTLYWLIFLLFLPMILDALSLEGLLGPVQEMWSRFLAFLPSLFAAGLILFGGWLGARILRQIVTNLLTAAGLDRAGESVGADRMLGKQSLSGLIGIVVYVLVLIPIVIAALDALQLGAISEPASGMLSTVLHAIPALFTAALILAIAYFVGRFLSGLVSELLSRTGFNDLPAKLGLGWDFADGKRSPSQLIGYLVLLATVFFAIIEASRQLQFEALAQILVQFVEFAGHLLLGGVILVVGLYLANLAAGIIESSQREERRFLAVLARVAILTLASAMALRQMGLADEIINTAFAVLLAAIGLAAALAFGLGARDVAGQLVAGWTNRFRNKGPGGPGGRGPGDPGWRPPAQP